MDHPRAPRDRSAAAVGNGILWGAVVSTVAQRRRSVARRGLLVLVGLVLIGLAPGSAGEAAGRLRGYYLFLAGAPQGCEDCYVPLLVTRSTLEEVGASGRDVAVVLITTYERDSIWRVEREVGLAPGDVSAGERIVRLRGRRYRYQEVAPAEVLRLLEKPMGTVPVHRTIPIPDRSSMEDLIAGFRDQDQRRR